MIMVDGRQNVGSQNLLFKKLEKNKNPFQNCGFFQDVSGNARGVRRVASKMVGVTVNNIRSRKKKIIDVQLELFGNQ